MTSASAPALLLHKSFKLFKLHLQCKVMGSETMEWSHIPFRCFSLSESWRWAMLLLSWSSICEKATDWMLNYILLDVLWLTALVTLYWYTLLTVPDSRHGVCILWSCVYEVSCWSWIEALTYSRQRALLGWPDEAKRPGSCFLFQTLPI